jgi:hypothetical protein
VTTTSSEVTATALKGTFNTIKLRELNPSVISARAVYGVNVSGKYELFSSAGDGSDVVRLTNNAFDDKWPAISNNGKIAFSSNRDLPLNIYSMNMDGSGVARVTDFPSTDTHPKWSPDNTKIAYVSDRSGSPEVWISDLSFHPVQLTFGIYTDISDITFAEGGAAIYFASSQTIYRVPTGGGSTTVFQSFSDPVLSISGSPDGQEIAVALSDSTEPTYVIRLSVTDGTNKLFVQVPNGYIQDVAWSTDGAAFGMIVHDLDGLTVFNAYAVSKDGSQSYALTNSPSEKRGIAIGPINKEHVLIAPSGGVLGAAAAALIYGQHGPNTTSVVTMEATTPSSVVLTEQTGLNSVAPNLVFSVDADNIVKMAYANGGAWKGIRVIGSSTSVLSATGALISMDAHTGLIVGILPFTGSRATGSKPSFADNGNLRTFSGSFAGAFDSKGNNIAPGGASKVTLDMTTGTLSAG